MRKHATQTCIKGTLNELSRVSLTFPAAVIRSKSTRVVNFSIRDLLIDGLQPGASCRLALKSYVFEVMVSGMTVAVICLNANMDSFQAMDNFHATKAQLVNDDLAEPDPQLHRLPSRGLAWAFALRLPMRIPIH